jgi:anti-sigma factor RsiW
MNCETWQDKIDAFVDSELTPAQQNAFEEHMRNCPGCSAETLARQRLKAETRLAGQRYTPSPEFVARMRGQHRVQEGRKTWTWSLGFAGAAAIMILAVVLGGLWRQNQTEQQLVGQLVDQHVAAMTSSNPVELVSSDPKAVKPWFSGKVPFSVDVPELEGTGYTLVGGKVASFRQVPAAHLVFGIRKHRISVFMFPERKEMAVLGNEARPIRKMGFATESWVEDGIRYFAISDADGQDVKRLCDLLKDADVT